MKSAFKSQWRSGLTLREQASTRDTAKHRWCLSVFFVLCLLSVKHCSFLPSVTSQQYLRTQHFSFFFPFLFLLLFSEWQQKRFVSVLVVTDDTCVLIKKSLSLPGELCASSIPLRVERQHFQTPVLNMLKHCTLCDVVGRLGSRRETCPRQEGGGRVFPQLKNETLSIAVETWWNLI